MEAGKSNRTRALLSVAGILVLLVLTAVFFHGLGRHTAVTGVTPEQVVGTNLASVSRAVAPANLPPLVATNAPGWLVGPGVAEMLRLLQDWRQRNPQYHMVVETTGPDLACTTEVFRFVTDQGVVVNRLKSEIRQPAPLTFVMEIEGERVRAYFPASNRAVEMDAAGEATRFLTQVGWGAGDLDLMAPARLSRASFVEVGQDYRAVTMVFSGAVFQMPRAAGDLFLTIQMDESGKPLSLEQLTLGMRAVSKLTYLDTAPAQIEAQSPRIPTTAVVTPKSFQEVLQEEVNWMKTPPAKPI